ncbi:hypothetical protein PVK06_038061 [Gossypium arboreum]|uniref:Uncharacterized protein n=1 Tax=Gossypium arboreum TaxID=29729 RepID=A0ABR0N168_GOSAR|nr:hypothetical protein PVK06_038061 [Gossypium arboreum]
MLTEHAWLNPPIGSLDISFASMYYFLLWIYNCPRQNSQREDYTSRTRHGCSKEQTKGRHVIIHDNYITGFEKKIKPESMGYDAHGSLAASNAYLFIVNLRIFPELINQVFVTIFA